MKITEAIKRVGRPVQFYPELARVFGIEESILLGQLLYWKGKEGDKEKGIMKSVKELENETALTKKIQERVKKKLQDLGCITYVHERTTHKTFYKVNEDQINLIFQENTVYEHTTDGSMQHTTDGSEACDQSSYGILPKVAPSIHRVHREYTESMVKVDKEVELLFDLFWSEYPLKKAKIRARQVWCKKIKDPLLAKEIIEDVKIRKLRERQWLEGYIPHPSTYLNGQFWDDEITPQKSKLSVGNVSPPGKYSNYKSLEIINNKKI